MLDPPVEADRDHVLGPPDGELVLVQYGSYACFWCRAVHNVIEELRSRFGERMQYVFRHMPVAGNELATRAAELSEYAAQTTERFWEVHEALMEQGPVLAESDLGRIAQDLKVPPSDGPHDPARRSGEVARARGHRERTPQRRSIDARILHQRPPLYRSLGREFACRRDVGPTRPPDSIRRL